jgi:hypothetical protein
MNGVCTRICLLGYFELLTGDLFPAFRTFLVKLFTSMLNSKVTSCIAVSVNFLCRSWITITFRLYLDSPF